MISTQRIETSTPPLAAARTAGLAVTASTSPILRGLNKK